MCAYAVCNNGNASFQYTNDNKCLYSVSVLTVNFIRFFSLFFLSKCVKYFDSTLPMQNETRAWVSFYQCCCHGYMPNKKLYVFVSLNVCKFPIKTASNCKLKWERNVISRTFCMRLHFDQTIAKMIMECRNMYINMDFYSIFSVSINWSGICVPHALPCLRCYVCHCNSNGAWILVGPKHFHFSIIPYNIRVVCWTSLKM